MSLFASLFGPLLGRTGRPVPPAPRPAPVHAVPTGAPFPLGLTVHQLTDAAIATLAPLHVRQVRTTVYASLWAAPAGGAGTDRATMTARLGSALAAGLDVLVVVHGGPSSGWVPVIGDLARRLPALAIQVGNECDAGAGAIAPADYVALWRAVRGAVRPATRLVTAGAGGPDSAVYARALAGAGLVPDAVAVHAYGPPPAAALLERLAPLRGATASPIWCTEFGLAPRDIRRAWPTDDPARDEARQAAEWQAVAAAAPGRVARAYGYCLDAAEGAGYGILRPDGSRRPVAAWLAARGD